MNTNTSADSTLSMFSGKIESGMLGQIQNSLKSLLNGMFNFDKIQKTEDGRGFTCQATLPDGAQYNIDVTYTDDSESTLELVVEDRTSHRRHTIHKVPAAKYHAAVEQAIQKLGGKLPSKEDAAAADEMDDSTMTASTRIQVGLRKVMSSTGYDLELTAIGGAQNIQGIDPSDIVASIVGDDAFAESVPEAGQNYQVVLIDDGAQVETIEAVEGAVTRISVIGMLAGLIDYLQDIHWNVHGEVFDHLHHAADNFQWDIRNAMDRLAEQEVMCNGAMPPMCEMRQVLPRPTSFDGDALLEHFRDTINSVASQLLMLAAISEDSTRLMLSGIANSFAAEVDYRLTRRYDLGRVEAVPICR